MLLCATADTAIRQLQETAERRSSLIHNERLLDTHFSLRKLVLNDRILLLTLLGQQPANESRLARPEEANQEIYSGCFEHMVN